MTKKRDSHPEDELLSSNEGIGRKLSDQALEDFEQDLMDGDNATANEQSGQENTDSAETAEINGADDKASTGNLVDDLKAAKAKATENWDHFVRAQAEMENLRRRSQREVENAHKYASEKFIQSLLPVIDSLEMGAEAASQKGASLDKIVEGMELTVKMFTDILEKFEIEKLDPTGESFNPEFHQAMSMQETADEKPNTILAVMQKGYKIKDRLIRPAMVVVAKALAKKDKNKEKDENVGTNIDEEV